MATTKSKQDSIPPVDIQSIPDLKARRHLPQLCQQYREVQSQITALEAAKRDLMTNIRSYADSLGVDKVAGDGWMLTHVVQIRTAIEAERLLQKGVKLSVIEYATVETPIEYWSVLNRKS